MYGLVAVLLVNTEVVPLVLVVTPPVGADIEFGNVALLLSDSTLAGALRAAVATWCRSEQDALAKLSETREDKWLVSRTFLHR